MKGKWSTLVLAAFILGLSVSAARAQDEKTGPSGYVTFQAKDMGLIISGQKGEGTLDYQGQKYPFKLKGMQVGSIGKVEMNASGKVYGLDKLEDFNGIYLQGKAALALKEGKAGIILINRHGVTMTLVSNDDGAELALGRGGVKIKLEKQKPAE